MVQAGVAPLQARAHAAFRRLLPRAGLVHARATVQILMNSLVLEILVLCMQFDGPDDDCDVDVQLLDGSCPIEINVVSVISSGIAAALITIPG